MCLMRCSGSTSEYNDTGVGHARRNVAGITRTMKRAGCLHEGGMVIEMILAVELHELQPFRGAHIPNRIIEKLELNGPLVRCRNRGSGCESNIEICNLKIK